MLPFIFEASEYSCALGCIIASLIAECLPEKNFFLSELLSLLGSYATESTLVAEGQSRFKDLGKTKLPPNPSA